MNDLVHSFQNTYDSTDAYETVAQFGDTAFDLLFDNGGLDGVPVISTLKGLYKATKNYQLYRLMKKMHRFIYLTNGTTVKEREKFITEYADKNKENGVEALFMVLDKIDNVNKVNILTNLIKAKIREQISIENFIRLTTILERIPYSDLGELSKYAQDYYEDGSTDSLIAAGVLYQSVIDSNGSNKYRLNSLGLLLLKFGMLIDIETSASRDMRLTDLEWHEA